ncbi:hypothetical protein [Pandoraea pulmonicola]|uniref:Uncharacterized protein n=1 Tax=Pandoraea pulmonicola TaxID=93221 RepID=A0AAJ4ZBS1_PANPU|nr:hypothetical protein [Pandoraea pulmonicola]AJC20988.1 hypothetical protein RO07_11830 [Pandoraea pulmonicola]SUA90403.1 Uncharacterised protein [Pandoraea pulmonicola]
MTCLNKWMIGACIATLSGVAVADDVKLGSSEKMMLANVGPAPLPVNVPPPPAPVSVAAVPAAPVTLYPFGRPGPDIAARTDDNALLYTHIEAINAGAPPDDHGHARWAAVPSAEPVTRTPSRYLSIVPASTPKLSLVQWDNADDKLGSDPKRGLSLKTDDWTVSASAKIPVLGQHDIGASVYVKRRF